jgi:hypothetical protein
LNHFSETPSWEKVSGLLFPVPIAKRYEAIRKIII